MLVIQVVPQGLIDFIEWWELLCKVNSLHEEPGGKFFIGVVIIELGGHDVRRCLKGVGTFKNLSQLWYYKPHKEETKLYSITYF